MLTLYTADTYNALLAAKLGDKKYLPIPDEHRAFSEEQRYLTQRFKAAFGIGETPYTFKVGINNKDEKTIYLPSVLADAGKVVISWGGQSYPVPVNATFSAGSCQMTVEVDDVEYSLKVRTARIEKADAVGKTQQDWVACKTDLERADMLNKLWSKGKLAEILASTFEPANSLAESVGTHTIIGYKLNTFEKYDLLTSEKKWLKSNTAICKKIEEFKDLGIEISVECPATLVIKTSTEKTAKGYAIYPTTLTAFCRPDLPRFDFDDMEEHTKVTEAVQEKVEASFF